MIYPRINVPNISSDFNIINDSCCNLSRFDRVKINISSSNIKTLNLNNLKPFYIKSDHVMTTLETLKNPNVYINHVSFPIITILSMITCIIVINRHNL